MSTHKRQERPKTFPQWPIILACITLAMGLSAWAGSPEQQGPAGPQGKAGAQGDPSKNGVRGEDGKDGAKGADGKDGKLAEDATAIEKLIVGLGGQPPGPRHRATRGTDAHTITYRQLLHICHRC